MPKQYNKFCVTSIRPKGKGKDVFENLMNPEKNDKKRKRENDSKKKRK